MIARAIILRNVNFRHHATTANFNPLNMKSAISLSTLPLVIFLAFAGLESASASLIVSLSGATAGESSFDADISATDLINYNQASLASASVNPGPVGGSPANAAYNGAASSGGNLANDYFFNTAAGAELIFTLNLTNGTGGSATGYDITKIQSIAGWQNSTFSAQIFSLSVQTLASGDTWLQIGTGSFDNASSPGNGNFSTETVLTDTTGTIASGVKALKFNFAQPVASGGTVLRELDVFGTATVVPEPSAATLLLGGFGALFFFHARPRRAQAFQKRGFLK